MKEQLSRRDFMRGVGVAAAGTAALGLAACASDNNQASAEDTQTANASANGLPATWDYEVDLAVAGFGIGGVVTALSAQEEGLNVLCVEAYTQVGGTAVDSSGGASAPPSMEAAMALMPYGNAELIAPFVEGLPLATGMLEGLDAPIRSGGTAFSLGLEATHEARLECFEHLSKCFTDEGGTLLMETKALKLLTEEGGRVVGLQARDKDKNILNIKAGAVVLACGGFQGNDEMKNRYFGPYGDVCVNRSVPTNDATMTLDALSIGAGLSKSLGSFYGHSMAANADVEFMDFSHVGTQSHDNRCIVVNLDGVRFGDEGAGVAGDINCDALVRQRWGRGCLIFDQDVYEQWGDKTSGGDPTGIHKTEEAKKRGGRVESADTIESLAEKMAAWGYNRAAIVRTVNEYNAAVDAGTTADLPVPRTIGMLASITKIARPPFWATEVVGGVSCCYGGLAINAKAEVLRDEDKEPIPGLYAIPGTAGGITTVHYYMSSLGAAAAYGYLGAKNAADYINAL